MIFAFSVPDALLGSLAGALFGSLIASAIVAYLTQTWIERRERRNRRDDLRLELYLEVVDLVLDNEFAIAERGADGKIAAAELQTKELRISHRLKLLGSEPVQVAYRTYRNLVFQETAHPLEERPRNPNDVVDARDRLIDVMAKDVQDT